MEEKDAEEAHFIESLQNLPLSSPESLPTSAEPKLSRVTNEDISTNHQRATSVDFEKPLQLDVSDGLSLTDKKSDLPEQSSNEAKESVALETTIQQDVCDDLSLNDNRTESPESSNEAKMSVALKTPVQQVVCPGGLSLTHNKVNLPESSNESKTMCNDFITPLSEEHNAAASRSLDKSAEVVQTTPLCKFEEDHAAPSKMEKLTEGAHDVQKDVKELMLSVNTKAKEDRPRVMARWPERQMSVGEIRKKALASVSSANRGRYLRSDKGLVDTAAPIESVKAAVTKFGGVVDWKAQRLYSMQRSGLVGREVDRIHKEISEYKRQAEAAEGAKALVLHELERTHRLIEDLKLDLERAQTEESHAKEDSEFVQLMVKELEEGVADDDSVAAKAQLKAAKERHEAVISELKSVKDELQKLQEDYDSIIIERDISIRKAEAAVAVSMETDKRVTELTLELNKVKESLELARATQHDAEEHKIGTSLARDEDCLTWQKEMKQAEEELQQLDNKLASAKDIKSKLDTSSNLLLKLNAELAAYMEATLNREAQGEQANGADKANKTRRSIQEALVSSRNELEEVKQCIMKAKNEVRVLQLAASSLKSELDKEKVALATLQQMEGMASIAVSSLEAELNRMKQEVEAVRAKEKEAQEKMVELPKMLRQAAEEADKAKSVARMAKEELRKAKEEAEQAKAGVSTTEFRLQAVLKEIEATKESERLALEAIRALEESEHAVNIEEQDSPRRITLPLDEYSALSKKAHEAEELAHERIATAIMQIEAAKESESKRLARLSDTYKEMEERKKALVAAAEKVERATEGKLAMEQELRTWRAENKQRRKNGDAAKREVMKVLDSPQITDEQLTESKIVSKDEAKACVHPVSALSASSPDALALQLKAKKKKTTFFPRVLMFFARKKPKAQK